MYLCVKCKYSYDLTVICLPFTAYSLTRILLLFVALKKRAHLMLTAKKKNTKAPKHELEKKTLQSDHVVGLTTRGAAAVLSKAST